MQNSFWGDRWESNPRIAESQPTALTTWLRPHLRELERDIRIELITEDWKSTVLPLN